MTALRLTPMAAPISLQVMPAAKQLLSCSIRSGVHGLVDGIRDGEGGIGTTGTIEAVATAAKKESAPHAQPSRIPPQGRKPAVAVAPVLRTKSGPLAAFVREPSPNQTVA